MDSEAQGALARLNGLLDELDDMYESSVGNLENRLSAARSAIEKARAKRGADSTAATHSADAREKGRQTDDREALLESISQYKQRIAELEKLSDELAQRDKEIVILKEKLDSLQKRDAEYDDIDAKLMEYDSQMAALEKSVQERNAEIEGLKSQLEKSESDKTEADERIKALQGELATAKEQADVLSEEAQEKEDELRGQREAAASLQQVLQERDNTIEKLEDKIKQHKEDMKSLREQLDRAVSESGAAELQKELDEKTDKIKQLEETVRTTEEERAKLELEVKMLLGEIEGMRYQHSELEMLQAKVEKLEKDLAEERAVIVRLKAQQTAPRAAKTTPAPVKEDKSEASPTKRVRAAAGGGKGKRGARKQMGEILVEAGVLTEQQLQEVIAFQATDPKRKLGSVVVERGYATEEVIAAALAAQLHVRFIENLEDELQPGVIKLVPNHLINNHRCVPLYLDAGQLMVAMANPLDLIGIENIELATNLRVEVAAATPTEIDRMIEKYFNRAKARK